MRFKRRRRRTLVWTLVIFALLMVGAAGSAFWLKGRELVAPDWLRERVAARLSETAPDVRIDFGDVVAVVDEGWRPRFSIRDVILRTPTGTEIISISDVRAGLDRDALFKGQLALGSFNASGVLVTMRRDADGAIALSAGVDRSSVSRQAPNIVQLVSDLDEFLLRPRVASLSHVQISEITLRYEDLRAGRAWTVDGGRLRLNREDRSLQIAVDLAILGGTSGVATLEANYAGMIGARASEFGITIANVDARDIASQGAAFGWLEALQAPISGALRGGLAEDGTFNPLNATFQIGAGVIQPTPEASPIPIDGARSYFSFVPAQQLLRFDELSLDTKWGRGQLVGHAVLGELIDGRISDLVGQFRLSDLSLNPAGLYPEPVDFASAELDFRLSLAPFEFQIGRFQLSDGGQMLSAQGNIKAGQQGWSIAADAQVDALEAARLIALWPEGLKPKTRRWVSENVSEGRVKDAAAALRLSQGERPRLYLGFDFEDTSFTFVRRMPPVQGARGHASLAKDRFSITFDEGTVSAPQGGLIDAAGTSFIVPDTTAKPDPPGIVRLAAQAPVTAALSLLDQSPLEVMKKANRPVDLLEGRIGVHGTISMPLKRKPGLEAISFDIAGIAEEVRSEKLVKDREVVAERLSVLVTDDEVSVEGPGRLDGVPLEVLWRQQLGRPGEVLPGRVTGTVEIDQAALDTFRIKLPPGMFNGSSSARFAIDLLKGTPPRLGLETDLQGVALSVPPVNWFKPADREAALSVQMTLGDDPTVDGLELDAPGLYASGSIALTETRALDRVRFDMVRIGNWFTAPVDLVARGEGQPVAVVVRGGTADLRRANLASSGGGSGGGPLTLQLDRLQVSDTIAITGLSGTFSTAGGLSGPFEGSVNGKAPVSGQLTPQDGRSAIRVASNNAGQVLAASGLMQQARGGRMDLQLVPVGNDGAFDGKLSVSNTSITDTPTMAALLNSISVVGLINELNGDGLYFSDVKADFRLTPSRITLREASATGASLGLSMDGIFEPDTGRISMEGVISPIYMLNSVGSALSRRGEGLFGFNYSITGTTKNPQVFVNPLTALAPGGLRNLFRGDRPEVPLEEGETAPVVKPKRAPVVTRGEDR